MRHRLLPRVLRIRGLRIPAIAAVAVAAALVSAPAQAAATAYVALGDSYSAGVGAGGYDPASGSCDRSSHSYPALWAQGHQPASFAFRACSGAVTATVVAGQLGSLNSSTSLVTITVGGNDVGFSAVVGTCSLNSSLVCTAAVKAAEALIHTVLPAELTATYAAIRVLAPHARLVVLGYPRLFETGATCATSGISQANRVTLNGGADALDAELQSRALAAGATFVDVRGVFAGHGVCSGSPWINGATADGAYHPNAAGYQNGYLTALDSVTG